MGITAQCYNGHPCYNCEEGHYTYHFKKQKFICVDCYHTFGEATD